MFVILKETTGTPRTYLNGTVSLPASGTVNINANQQLYIARDPQLIKDVNAGFVLISDGQNDYGDNNAVTYLEKIFTNLSVNNQTGTITTTGQSVEIYFGNASVTTITVKGTWTGILAFEATTDPAGTNASYGGVFGSPLTGGTPVLTVTGNGTWVVSSGGLTGVRIRATSLSSGSVDINLNASSGTNAISGTNIANQGTPNSIANAWPTYLALGGVAVSSTNPLNVNLDSVVGIQTTTPLGSNGVYTSSPGFDTLQYGDISVVSYANQAGSFTVEWSNDNVTWYPDGDVYQCAANVLRKTSYGCILRYFRIIYTNGSVAQGNFMLNVTFKKVHMKPSSHRIGEVISDDSDAELSKSVLEGKNPDGNFINIRAQGSHTGNSTSTPLAAGATYRGTWFPWQENYTKMLTDLYSDVAGTFYIEFSEAINPANGVDTDVLSPSLTYSYSGGNALLNRSTPTQSKWVRVKYVNGMAAQSIFVLDTAFVTSDPGLPQQSLSALPTSTTHAGIVRSVISTAKADGTYQEWPRDNSDIPKVAVTSVGGEVTDKAFTTNLFKQLVVGTTATRIDADAPANRKYIQFSNEGPGRVAIGTSAGITFDSAAYRCGVGRSRGFPVYPGDTVYAITENTGGTQSTLTRNPTSASGTATNPNNVIGDNGSYAVFTANGQTITATGFTAGTTNTLVSVKLGIQGFKQASQLESVTFQDVQKGNSTNLGTVSTTSNVTGVNNHFYVAAISREANQTVTTVTGLGLTWTKLLQQNSDDSNRAVDVWWALGTVSGNGIVTASFASTTSGAHISVARYSNVDPNTPIQASAGANGNSSTVSTAAVAGTNGKGYTYMAAAIDNATTFTAGAGYTNVSTDFSGDSLGVLHKVSTASDTPSATISSSKHWAAISLTMTPAPAIDPTITLSYTLSAVAGLTTGSISFSSSSDANFTVDVTADRSWTVANIPNVNVIATVTALSAAQLSIDHMYLELVDSTGNTTRLSIYQGGVS